MGNLGTLRRHACASAWLVALALAACGGRNGASTNAAKAAPGLELDDLTAAEIATGVAVLRADPRFPKGGKFALVTASEPEKGQPAAVRTLDAIVYEPKASVTTAATVDVQGKRVLAWRTLPAGVLPYHLWEEYSAAEALARANPEYLAALQRRGLDPKKIYIEMWAPGMSANVDPSTRLMRAVPYVWDGGTQNRYARPIVGLEVIVDLNRRAVARVVDDGAGPVPGLSDYLGVATPPPALPLRPLETIQPQGPSFVAEHGVVRWHNWQFRVSVDPREGLILRDVSYQDRGKARSILHRASVVEVAVPYADTRSTWAWRMALDQGEYGFGRYSSGLVVGRDAPNNARLFDAVMADDDGKPQPNPGAAMIYELDGGLQWTHTDGSTGEKALHRGRKLVVASFITIGNYDYGVYWTFGDDGSIDARVDLTGMLLPEASASSTCESCQLLLKGKTEIEAAGRLVAPNLTAPLHQHFFSFRLDFDIDGRNNAIVELESRTQPVGPNNPDGKSWVFDERLLASEKQARRDLEASANRRWKVVNLSSRNALGHMAGYMINPGPNTAPLQAPDSLLRRSARFVDHHLWVTRYDRTERFPAGDFVLGHAAQADVQSFGDDDQPLTDTDLVVWYTAGITHVPSPEQWPIMPAATVGFRLTPDGFFDRNPQFGPLPAAPAPAAAR